MKKLILVLGALLCMNTASFAQWNMYNSGVPYSLFSVDFIDENTGVAVGQGGSIIRTTDGGDSWISVYQEVDIWLNRVKFTPVGVFAVGKGGVILKSVNDGANWFTVRPFSNDSHTLRDIAFQPEHWWLFTVGYAGAFFVSTDWGNTWEQKFHINKTMHSIAFSPNSMNNKCGIIVGTDGAAWRTANNGENWVPVNTGRYDYLNTVKYTSNNNAIVVGNNGTILRSSNNGFSWSVLNHGLTTEHLRDVDTYRHPTDSNNATRTKVTVCGDNGKIMTSDDGGAIFFDQMGADSRHLYGVSLREYDAGIIVGEIGSAASGAMLFTLDNGISGINPIGSEVPQKFEMSQNYPNPFNPSTKINFSMPLKGQVQLTVFDMSGKVVATLVNTYLAAGSYEFEFNASNLSSGVYFYKLVTNDFVQTKKMTLIK